MDEELVTYDGDDRAREVRFTGRLIGHASSHKPSRTNWTTISIYRTAADQFVVHTVGHTTVQGEREFHKTVVAQEASGIIDSLHRVDDEGSLFLTWTARQAIEDASSHDEDFAAAYRVQHVA